MPAQQPRQGFAPALGIITDVTHIRTGVLFRELSFCYRSLQANRTRWSAEENRQLQFRMELTIQSEDGQSPAFQARLFAEHPDAPLGHCCEREAFLHLDSSRTELPRDQLHFLTRLRLHILEHGTSILRTLHL